MKILYALLCCLFSSLLFGQLTPFEKSDGNYSANFTEVMEYYSGLVQKYPFARFGKEYATDCGEVIQPILLGNPATFEQNPKLLINNGVHPGESCGVDASLMLVRDILSDQSKQEILNSLSIIIIPIYNIGGSLNSSCCTRANQNGPSRQGFRGNARNLDLNRDYIKQDSRNAKSLTDIFNQYFPEFFVDTHTSNGADYPYTMTLLQTQKDKLHPMMANFISETFEPLLYNEMDEEGWPMIPYVNSIDRTPNNGIAGFLESPRFATGFTGLYQTIGYTTEAHMLKPYADRVWSTYKFLQIMVEQSSNFGPQVSELRKKCFQEIKQESVYPINWTIDTTEYQEILFEGYQAEFTKSKLTGLEHFTYNRNRKWKERIPFYNSFNAIYEDLPKKGFLIPYAYKEVVSRIQHQLKYQGKIYQLQEKTAFKARIYHIEHTETRTPAYEGHHLHYNTEVSTELAEVSSSEFDYFIPIEGNERHLAFLLQVFSPQAIDSYFNWNFFDEILQRKEYFSPYAFEQTALDFLSKNKGIKEEFEQVKKTDSSLMNSHYNQLMWIYKKTGYAEQSHNRYPVYFIEE